MNQLLLFLMCGFDSYRYWTPCPTLFKAETPGVLLESAYLGFGFKTWQRTTRLRTSEAVQIISSSGLYVNKILFSVELDLKCNSTLM